MNRSRAEKPNADSPPLPYRLVAHEGRLRIESGTGEAVSWASYTLTSERVFANWTPKYPGLIKAGLHLFGIANWPTSAEYFHNVFWSYDGQPVAEPRPPLTLGEQAAWLLEQDPEARLMIRISTHPDAAWRRQHLEQFQPMSGGNYSDGRSFMPSLASDLCRERTAMLVRDHIRWCERQPWRDRIVAYHLLPFAEGTTEVGIYGDLFDTSEPMQAAFRAFARQKYGTDAALRAAWNDPAANLADVRVPTRDEWFAKRDRLKLLHWPDPALVQRERDYFLLQKEVFHQFWSAVLDALGAATAARPVLTSVDNFKQHQQGWLHNGCFFGDWEPGVLDNQGSALLASGCIGVAPLLDHPGLGAVWNPGMYYNRAMGYAWEAEGVTDSLTLRGKVNYCEADMRTWVNRDWSGNPRPVGLQVADAGVVLTVPEMTASFRRNLAWALSRNQMYWFCSVCGGNWWYDDPLIQREIRIDQDVIRRSLELPWRDTPDAVCIVIDDESALDEDFSSGFQYLAVFRQIEEGLALCGVPYRIHLLADLARDDFPAYKCYLFPNLFRIDARVEALLRRRVLRDGHVAVFGPGTGVTDGCTLSAEPASRLFGVPMELVAKRSARRVLFQDSGHPISRRLRPQVYGDSYAFGPVLAPAAQRLPADDPSLRPLGNVFFFHNYDRPGLFCKEFGLGACGSGAPGPRGADDYAVVFSPAIPLPPELLRECARHAGCHIWLEENAVIYAADGFVALHSVRRGRQRLRLPCRADVTDLISHRVVARNATAIQFNVTPPVTRLFSFKPVNSKAPS